MSEQLPSGYRIVYVKETINEGDKGVVATPPHKKCGENVPYYVGEMCRTPFPLHLFIKISDRAHDVFWAGQTAIRLALIPCCVKVASEMRQEKCVTRSQSHKETKGT